MSSKKNTGSYYTPSTLSDFLTSYIIQNYLSNELIERFSILEPSCGNGQFVSSFIKYYNDPKKCSIDLLEINKKELDQAKELGSNNKNIELNIFNQDYLKYFLECDKRYSLIMGNPPYINKKHMERTQINRCEKIHTEIKKYSSEISSFCSIKNIWPAFVEAAIMSLNPDGVLCFIIPAEILQVKYTSELRSLISKEFDRVEIFAFNELVFEGVQQDVVALIGVKNIKDTNQHGISFYQVDKLEDLKEPKFTEKHSNIHRTNLDKWTNYMLSDQELNLIHKAREKFNSIKFYCKNSEVGIVSAANDYFIIDDNNVKLNQLTRIKNLIKPILSRGEFVTGLVNFNEQDLIELRERNKRINFLHFNNVPKNKFGKIINRYLSKGEKINLHKRYKMLRRENWYHVPSTWKSEGFFVKRCHIFPKMIVNEANVLATDSFYRVNMKSKFNIKNLVFSFYNSLTFVLSELEGRFYGGGVLELTPNEFKNLSIPYNKNITDKQFEHLDEMLRNNDSIENILAFTNPILIDGIDFKKLEIIRIKLVNRRIKKRIQKKIDNIIKLNISKKEKFHVKSSKISNS